MVVRKRDRSLWDDASLALHLKELSELMWISSLKPSLYRSRHELVFVLRNRKEAYTNNGKFRRFGRNRTNVWNYAGANSFARKGR